MRFKRHLELEHGLKQIDIAPLIDIMFQLLIFFMLTYSFVTQPGIRVNLPKLLTSEIVEYENIEVVLSGKNSIYLNGKEVTVLELRDLFKQASKRKQTVLIKADKRASLGRIVEIWDICRDLGITQISIATSQE